MIDSKLAEFISQNSSDGINDDLTKTVNTISIGYVVDTDDPLEAGRLRIFCGDFNDNPKKLHHIPWATYSAPYGGSINNGGYTRGHIQGQESTSGAVHYGFWGIPEQGAHVLVACINGDIRRRVWLGCIPEHQETHTLFTGRFDWSGGFPDGPLSSTKSPIEPSYTNASKAFNDDKKSAEWKTRIASYQPMSVREDLGENPNPTKSTYLDNQFQEISKNEKDDWVKGILGSHGYDWSGYKKLGSFKASRVYGMSTPGFHSFSMDDRPFNSRIHLKTTAGHQILLDDTNERIYISTYEGKSYIEMDKSGNIDMYCDKRLSIHSKQDINLESDETVRIKGKKGIHMYAGDTTGQTPIDETPPDGQIRLHSTDDMHFFSENNLRALVKNDAIFEFGGEFCTSVGKNYNLQVENDINTITNDGDMNNSITGSLLLNASSNISQFAGNSTKHQSINNTEIFSFRGKMDIAAQMDLNLKSKGESVAIESVKKSVALSGSEETSMVTLDSAGITQVTEHNMKTLVKEKSTTTVSPNVTVEGVKTGAPGCIVFPGVTVTLTNDGLEEHEGDLDVTYKLPNGVERTMKDVNKFMEDMEEDWNNHMQLYQEQLNSISSYVTDIFAGVNAVLPIPPWLGALPISFNFALPAITLPNLNLPTLCFDLSNILNIEGLELLPNTLFEVNVDLGGWTKANLDGWVNGLKGEVRRLKSNFTNAIAQIAGIQNQIDAVLNQLTNAVTNIRLLSINFTNPTGTDSDVLYANYNISIGNAINSLNNYNTTVISNGLPSAIAMLSELASHVDSNNTILSNVTSGGLNNTDLITLEDAATKLEGYVLDLGGNI